MAGDAPRGSWLRRLTGRRRPPGDTGAERQPARFLGHYQLFGEILGLNDSLLEAFAALEDARAEGGASATRAVAHRLRRAMADVERMVAALDQMTGGRQRELTRVVRQIVLEIEHQLPHSREPVPQPYVLALRSLRARDARLAGTKMANLGEAWWGVVGAEVPEGFVITSAAFVRLMAHNRLWPRVDRLEEVVEAGAVDAIAAASRELSRAILDAELPGDVERAVLDAFDRLAEGDPRVEVAVRSSAIGEDGAASHAGQYHTALRVDRARLLDAYREVVASAYGPGPTTYRAEQGLPEWEATMAVGCMQMIEPRRSGILFSRDYAAPEGDRVVLSAVAGLSDQVAAGTAQADDLVVTGPAFAPPAGSCLSPSEVLLLVKSGRALERYFGKPVDVEWALTGGDAVFLLQVRPMVLPERIEDAPPDLGDGQAPLVEGGVAACAGGAAGPVCHVDGERDLDRFPRGGVLVARHSAPRWSRVFGRCAAVVTEVGSPCGHMSILARERGLPAIVGVPGALAALAEGQVVTVDAWRCRVFAGALPVPPQPPPPASRRDADSQMREVLRAVADRVVPLHLTNPAADDFTPSGCRSLHDVTRYVHEQLYQAMFRLGDVAERDRGRSARMAVRLPFEVLVFDAGGGVAPGAVEAGEVRPEDVTSRPFQALLGGLLDPRIRWAVPRPVSRSGFLSVLGESMAGPPPEAQQLGRASYAVVADRYLNFSIKAGYHFSVIDAYCDPEALNRNYIHFRFAGGGAGSGRRQRRVGFLERVLLHHGFDAKPRGDALVARLEKYPAAELLERLTILGQLTMVTRQMDMLMDSDGSPAFFAQAFLAGKLEIF